MRKLRRWGRGIFVASSLGGVGISALGACAGERGSIMLAITTDMQAPKDVNAVSLTVLTNNVPKFNTVARVTPEGEVLLPATIAIVEPDDPNASIRIKVMAFKDQKPMVLRDVRTTVPRDGRIALLRLPLNFVNTPSVAGSPDLPPGVLPAPNPGSTPTSLQPQEVTGGSVEFPFDTYLPNCPNKDTETWIDGECRDSFVDSSTLPTYSEAEVFGGGSAGEGACFDVTKCFTSVQQMQPDPATCQVDIGTADPANVNFALATNGIGKCVASGDCYVPVDHGEGGWSLEGTRAQLPKWVCTLVGQGNRLIMSNGCAQKTVANPVCQDTPPGAVGGRDAGADGEAGPQAPVIERIIDEDFPISVAVAGNRVIWASKARVGTRDMTNPTDLGSPLGGIPASYAPWNVRTTPLGILFANGSSTAWQLSPPAPPVTLSFDGGVSEGDVLGSDTIWVGGLGGGLTFGSQTYYDAGFNSTPRTLVSLGASSNAIAVGLVSGAVTICSQAGACMPEQQVSASPIDRLVVLPQQSQFARGLALAADGLYRIDQTTFTSITSSKLVGLDATPLQVGPPLAPAAVEHRRGLDTAGNCAFVSTPKGVEFVVMTEPTPQPRQLFAAPAGAQVLGVAFGNIDGAPRVYFAVHAPVGAGGGGIYRSLVPPACGGAGNGGGGTTDAGANPGPDAAIPQSFDGPFGGP